VVTGLGAVTPLGNDVRSSWENLLAGRPAAGPITAFETTGHAVTFACELTGFEPTLWIDSKQARRMDRFAQMIVVAARQAQDDAGLEIEQECDRIGVSVASGMGGLRALEVCCDTLTERGPERVARSRSQRSSRTWALPRCRSSWARVARLVRSAQPVRRRRWRSATAWTRSGSAARR
jgi:3-oxoacyl-[acyl-carrier-protein] synthase II